MGFIYRIVSNDRALCYYGSTVKSLHERFYRHQWMHKHGIRKYTSYDVFEHDPDCIIEEVEVVDGTPAELYARESWWVRNNECVNCQIPLRTRKEYYADTKEESRRYHNQWVADHRQRYLDKLKEWRSKNPNYMKEWRLKKKG